MTGLLFAVLLVAQGGTASVQTGGIAGKLQKADGSPAAGVRISAIDSVDGASPAASSAIIALAVTDAAGRYTLADLPPGRYLLVVGALELPMYFPGVLRKSAASVITVGRTVLPDTDFRLMSDNERARFLLSSSDPMEIAWGAWIAGGTENSELAAPLEQKLAEQLAKVGGSASIEIAIDTLADALVRLKAKPSASLLALLFDRRPHVALVLMSHVGQAANPVLLDVLKNSSGLQWTAAANLLLTNRAPGFAAALLRGLSLYAQLDACQPGSSCGSGGGMSSVGDWGQGAMKERPAGSPPRPSYGLSAQSGVLFAEGPRDVFYIRGVAAGSVGAAGASYAVVSVSAADRLKYLSLVAPGVTIGIRDFERRSVEWRDQETFSRQTKALREDIQERYTTLLRQLQEAGVLTAAEAVELSTPNLTVQGLRH